MCLGNVICRVSGGTCLAVNKLIVRKLGESPNAPIKPSVSDDRFAVKKIKSYRHSTRNLLIHKFEQVNVTRYYSLKNISQENIYFFRIIQYIIDYDSVLCK